MKRLICSFAFAALLQLVVTVEPSPAGTITEVPEQVHVQIGERSERLALTGTAVRKKFGVALYRIASYCAATAQPQSVDDLSTADVSKRLVLVMERDVADWILRQGFSDAFQANDPEQKHPAEIKALLDYFTADSLKAGDRIVVTHLPQAGVQCAVGDRQPLTVTNRDFAFLVWRVFMGPKAVTPDLRRDLGNRLASRPQNVASDATVSN